jgi:hypothetical protein
MKIYIIIGAVGIISIILIYAATKPDVYPIERSIYIIGSAEEIFPMINSLKEQGKWTPYEADKTIMTYRGADSGVTSAVVWDSEGKAGKGSLEITKSQPPNKVEIDLRMERPFKVTNKVEFTIEPHADSTKVTWRMQHNEPYPAKVIGIFMNMDKMVGKDFEVGLSRLKKLIEKK